MMVEKEAKGRVVVVLGMHRSGTSAISSAIDGLGLNFGDNLYGPREDNPAGFWENESLVQFNDTLLAEVGMRWDSFGLIDDSVWSDGKWESWFENAANLLRDEFSDTRAYGIKDPRISKLLGFWQLVFQRNAYDVKYVVAFRNPLEVMASLNKRDGFDAVKSQLLWLEYTLSALQSTEHSNRLLVSYNDLMADPTKVINSLAGFLIDFFEGEIDSAERPVNVLKAEYRHTSFTPEELVSSHDALGVVVDLYLVMYEYTQGKCDSNKLNMRLDNIISCYSLSAYLPHAYEKLQDKIEMLSNENKALRERSRYQLFMDFIKGKKST